MQLTHEKQREMTRNIVKGVKWRKGGKREEIDLRRRMRGGSKRKLMCPMRC